MQLLILLVIGVLLLFVLSARLTGFDLVSKVSKVNKVDDHTEKPSGEEAALEEAAEEAQLVIPVQYIDNGLLPKIESNMSSVTEPLKSALLSSTSAEGPSAYSRPEATKSYADTLSEPLTMFTQKAAPIKSILSSEGAQDAEVDGAGRAGRIEPFNSFAGAIVASTQMISSLEAIETEPAAGPDGPM